MKLFRNLLCLLMITCSLTLYSTEKPSAWSKFKNIFKSKKQESNKQNEGMAEFFKNDLSLIQSIKKLYGKVSKFYDFSQEHMTIFNLKIKGLKDMQIEGAKSSQKDQLKMPLKRLRADLLMSLIEYLKETKLVMNDIKTFMKERKYSDNKIFDSLLQTFDTIIKEGDLLTESLLQASDAYGSKDNVKKIEIKISAYFNKIAQLFSAIKTPIDSAQTVINKAIMPLLKGATIITLGGTKPLLVLFNQLDNILKLIQISTDIVRDIVEGKNKSNKKEINALENQSYKITQSFESSKKDIKKIENALNRNENVSSSSGLNKDKSTDKSINELKKDINYGKPFDTSNNQEDELVFEDLSSKKTK